MSAISGITSTVIPPPNQSTNATTNEDLQTTEEQSTSGSNASGDTTETQSTTETSSSSDTSSNTGTDSGAPQSGTTASTSASDSTSPTAEATPSATTKATAESQIAAKSDQFNALSDTEVSPQRIEEQRSQELAVARELAEQYREARAREEALQGFTSPSDSEDKGRQMDLRVPLIDEIPDRPLPRADVPIA